MHEDGSIGQSFGSMDPSSLYYDMKVKINAMIDKSILERFKAYVLSKHEKLYKAMGEELENAILYYLNRGR